MFKYIDETIVTNRLLLRPFTLDDANEVAKLCNNYNLYKATLSLPYPYTSEMAKSWIETHDQNRQENKYYDFAIVDKINNALLGTIGLSYSEKHHHGEVGYWIGEPYWNQQIASEALEAMLRFAFDIKDYNRVFGRHFGFNEASGRVMQKCGLMYEGTLKKHIYKDDKYHDIVYYGITSDRYVSN